MPSRPHRRHHHSKPKPRNFSTLAAYLAAFNPRTEHERSLAKDDWEDYKWSERNGMAASNTDSDSDDDTLSSGGVSDTRSDDSDGFPARMHSREGRGRENRGFGGRGYMPTPSTPIFDHRFTPYDFPSPAYPPPDYGRPRYRYYTTPVRGYHGYTSPGLYTQPLSSSYTRSGPGLHRYPGCESHFRGSMADALYEEMKASSCDPLRFSYHGSRSGFHSHDIPYEFGQPGRRGGRFGRRGEGIPRAEGPEVEETNSSDALPTSGYRFDGFEEPETRKTS